MSFRNRHSIVVASTLTLAVLAGCQTVRPGAVAPGTETTFNGKGSTGAAVKPGTNGNVANGQTGAGAANALNTEAKLPDWPSRDQVLQPASKLNVQAEMGGLYKSADGTLEAIIPPGALTSDTNVRFAAVDTTKIAGSAVFTPGISIAMDLGGAQLNPGAVIMVKSKVDPRFVEMLQKDAPGVDLAERGLTQDNGVWYLTMPVKNLTGPDAEQMQSNPVGTTDMATIEFMPKAQTRTTLALAQNNVAAGEGGAGGSTPASTAPSAAPSVAPSAEPTLTPINTDDSVVNGFPAMPVAKAGSYAPLPSMRVRALGYTVDVTIRNTVAETMNASHEYIHCFIAHGWCGQDGVYGAINDAIRYNKALASNHQPPDALRDRVMGYKDWDCTVGNNRLTTVTVKADYESDDASVLATKPNATITVNAAGNVVNHAAPSGTVSFQAGLDVAFGIYASINSPTYKQGATKNVTVTDGLTVNVKVPKYSPYITLKLTSGEQNVTGPVHVEYTLDGTAKSKDLTVATNTKAASLSYYELVGNDSAHTLALTSVSNGDLRAIKLPGSQSVQRNGTNTFNVTLVNSAAK